MSAAPDLEPGVDRSGIDGRCAVLARAAGERGLATAPPVTSWLLIEHSGSWPRQAAATVLPGLLPDQVARQLGSAIRAGLRPLLLRRPGRTRPGGPRAVFVGWSAPHGSWLERLAVQDLAELEGLDLAAVAAGVPGHGAALERPLLLVCTHSSRDLCCSLDGRPLAVGLARSHGEDVWECSHVGGDRFAGNLVVLPYGEYHGRVDPDAAAAIASAAGEGSVRLEHFRGRTSYDGWQQAAEIAVRERTALRRRDDVSCGPAIHENGTATVDVVAGEQRWRVIVQRRTLAGQPPTRCTARLIPIAHEVVDMELLPPVV